MKTFTRGHSTFNCAICGRLTRETGEQGGGNHLCPQCWDISGQDNYFNDEGKTPDAAESAELLRLLSIIAERGGDVQAVVDANDYAFPNGLPAVTQLKAQTRKDSQMNATTQTLPTINALHFIAAVDEEDVILHEETRRTKIFRAIAKTGKKGATVEDIAKATKLDVKAVKADVYTLARLFRISTK